MAWLDGTLEYVRQGGWIMVPLVGVSVVMWTAILDRLRVYRALAAGDLDGRGAVAAVAAGDTSAVAGRAGLKAALVHDFLVERTGRPQLDRDILGECALRQRRRLRRGLAVITVLAAVAPLLGLLGTVLGMIETFDVIAAFGTGNARALAGGISVALITTQTGLLVAIPGMIMANRLTRRADALATGLDEVSAAVARHLGRSGKAVTT
jgi:biopolymer transport protein ExbB